MLFSIFCSMSEGSEVRAFAAVADRVSLFRHAKLSVVAAAVKEAMQLKKDFPDFLAGFDLVRSNRSR